MNSVRQVLDLLQPRTLAVSLARGTWILLRLLVQLLRAGLRKAVGGTAPAAPKGPPPKVNVRKTTAPPAEAGDAEGAGEEPPARPAPARTDRLQNAALTLVVLVVAAGALRSVGAAVLYLLRPYMTLVVAAGTLAWFAAALTADAVTRPRNDHENAAGEEGQEQEPGDVEDDTEDDQEDEEDDVEDEEDDPWPAQEKLLVKYVEQRVATVAAGKSEHVKGRGARVIDLLTEQQENGGLIGLDQKAMIDLLEKAGIPYREQMKFRVLTTTPNGTKWAQKNNPGVHVEDMTKYLSRRPQLPPHLIADLTPNQHPVPALVAVPDPAPETPPIPLQRAAGE